MKRVRTATSRMARLKSALALGCIASALCASASPSPAPRARIETGTLQGASYRIDIPARWNHKLVVYYHGYSDTPITFGKDDPLSPMFDPLLGQGYALVQSGYSQGGWAVEQASAETERLRKFFVAHHGAPAQTLVMGMSMGGTLTALTIERHPEIYSGALSLCGAIEPSDRLVARDFALRAAFDYYFPNLLGPLVPVPSSYNADDAMVAKIAAALRSNPKAREALLRWYRAADEDNFPSVIAFAGPELRELQQRAHGNPVGNADLIYLGSGDDAALNDGVRRYRADPRAAAYLAHWYTPSGNLVRPMLELHDTGDPLVPADGTFEYALAAQRTGHGDDFVQQYVVHEGHCVFTPQQIGTAFGELIDWLDHGRPPSPGRLPSSPEKSAAQ
jgi:pimeloyl-ACP methyl ester carboxylesterase